MFKKKNRLQKKLRNIKIIDVNSGFKLISTVIEQENKEKEFNKILNKNIEYYTTKNINNNLYSVDDHVIYALSSYDDTDFIFFTSPIIIEGKNNLINYCKTIRLLNFFPYIK